MFREDQIEEVTALSMEAAGIENYPHVVEKLRLFWGYPEFIDYYSTLVKTDRQKRLGFPNHVLLEIIFLYNLYLDNMKDINRTPMTDLQIIQIKAKLGASDVWNVNFER